LQNPYKITEQEDGFVFETDFGLSYKITFLKHNAFDDLGFSSYEFGFYPVGEEKRFKDQRIEDTIIFALDDFFQKNPDCIILYVCDSLDNRARERTILFDRWYKKYTSDTFAKLNRKIFDTENDMIYYFAVVFNQNFIQPLIIESFIEAEETIYNK